MKHREWVAVSGFSWLFIGFFLTYKGVRMLADSIFEPHSLSLRFQDTFGSPQQAATVFIGCALIVGFLKGRFILSKTVGRVVCRIAALPLPIRLKDVYAPSYLILIGSMMGLGMLLKFLPIPMDIKGMIDVAIGSALINGAILYFRVAQGMAKKLSVK